MIHLIVGLGNPGADYAASRHNAGFWLVDQLARMGRVSLRNEPRFCGHAARATLWGHAVWLLQPQTFMNRSGLSVMALSRFYKIAPSAILVAHDELDLPPGAVKLKLGGGSGGHNGLKDIAAQLATQQFWRLRLGIGHPRDALPPHAAAPSGRHDVAGFVLKPPRKEEQAHIDRAIARGLDALPDLIAGNPERAMMRLHTAD